MGTRGIRNNSKHTYIEPDLLSGVADIRKLAFEKHLYSGEALDVEQLIEQISTNNPKDPIVIRKKAMDNYMSGSLTYENGTWIMTVNSNQHPRRQRFTLAHELGHYILHKEKNAEFQDSTFFRSSNMDNLEYMANDFAAKLLMPDDIVKKFIDRGVRNLGDLANKFEVSVAAMKFKVEKMGYKVR